MKTSIFVKFLCAIALAMVAGFTSHAQVTLLDTNSNWRYLADGTDQGTAWKEILFDDSTWTSAQGKFGFGGDAERTVIGTQANGYTNFYFRTTFTTASDGSVVARHIRDDGLVVYIDGAEAFRSNMPMGPIEAGTQASTVVSGTPETSFFTNVVLNVPAGDHVLAVEVHQRHGATAFSSDLGFYMELYGDVPPQPPTVSVQNPNNGDVIQGSSVTLNATASDIDGTITQVEFFLNSASAGTDTTTPYLLTVNSVAPGNYAITAVATDSQGLRATSAPVNITVVTPAPSLVPFGATWRYLDNGSDQGTAWIGSGFDDSGWSSGQAELGYGDNDEATVIGFGGDPANRFITTYFRHTFNVANPGSISSLTLRVARDDGIVVYLNGTEILRDNMPTGPITYLTQATNAVEDNPLVITSVPPSLLIAGANIISAEVHQNTNTSSDVSFDLNLIHNSNLRPVVNITTPTNNQTFTSPANITVNATAYDLDGAINFVQFFLDGTQIGTNDFTVGYGRTANNVPIGQHTLTAIAHDFSGLTATSRVVVVVNPGASTTVLVGTNSTWRYLDDGSDQGLAWTALAFDDSAWRSGQAELGFGDDPRDEVTLIRRTNEITGMTNITFYFRHVFNVEDPATYTNLVLNLRRDDGAVVYINDAEVFRSNMPEGPIFYNTFAGNSTGSETAFNTTNLNSSVLVAGQNIVAVEVHQQNLGSSDVSFELQLLGIRPAGPLLTIVNNFNGTATLSWFPSGGGFVLQQAPTVLGPWTTSPSQSNPQTISTISPAARFYRLCRGCP